MSRPRNSLWPRPTLPPPFDISTFDPSTLIPEFTQVASEDPDLCLVQEKPDPMLADSAWDFVRRSNTVEVAPNVLALGKNPFPKLRDDIHIPDFDYRNYDRQMPWFGESFILKWLTPHELWERGCINTMLGKSISRQFQVDTAVAAKACRDRPTSHYTDIHGYKWPVGYCNSYVGSHDGIHPIVRRSNFRNTSDYEYECLKPTLRIASRMLKMDSVLDQLWALGQPWTKVPDTKTTKDNYVYYTGRSTAPQRFETAQELRQLSNYVHFDWGNVAPGLNAHALTEHLTDKPGLRGGSGTCACKVELHNKFRYVIAGGTGILANLYNPQANNDSSLLRTQLWLAMIILHELGHVFL
ncbi:hypothetical protein E4T50_09673 [Aureobasidium sp. EXF-12298]|nr:hypothetical protein E4T50_09673 [Aureobasidium sp. EXF-12298]